PSARLSSFWSTSFAAALRSSALTIRPVLRYASSTEGNFHGSNLRILGRRHRASRVRPHARQRRDGVGPLGERQGGEVIEAARKGLLLLRFSRQGELPGRRRRHREQYYTARRETRAQSWHLWPADGKNKSP